MRLPWSASNKFAPLPAFTYICRLICLRSLMDRISDSGSDGCGSIPHGGTKNAHTSTDEKTKRL